VSNFPIGSRVGGNTPNGEVPMKVLGHHGTKGLIVEVLETISRWQAGQIIVVPVEQVIAREEVTYVPGEAEDGNGPAIGWMELGGLSVGLTRARDGALLLSLERAPDYPEDHPVTVRVARQNDGNNDLWEGDIT
jgi:hypothetical protein